MNIEIVNEEKDDVELKIDNTTIAEILRAYLNDNVSDVSFAAWRKEHPSKPLVFRIKTSGKTVKKAIGEAVSGIGKDLDNIVKAVKK